MRPTRLFVREDARSLAERLRDCFTAALDGHPSAFRDEKRVVLEGDRLVVEVKNGRQVLTHLPAGPRPAVEPVRHYFDTE